MGVVTVSSSTAQATLGLCTKFSTRKSTTKRPLIVAFKSDKSNNSALVAPHEQILPPLVKTKEKKRRGKSCQFRTVDLDYNEAAAKLENIFKLSPASDTSDAEEVSSTTTTKRGGRRKKRTSDSEEKRPNKAFKHVVRNQDKKPKRMSLNERLKLRNDKEGEVVASIRKKNSKKDENEMIEELVREYSGTTDLASLDWKKMKIPPVLPSTEHTWLFKLMQPMKALLKLKEDLQENLGREPTEGEFAEATNSSVVQVRRQIDVGRAARNKLIKHNLRLVLFVINKYFHDFANGPKFQDLCQAGVKGLITAIDRFEPNRRFRLSTYGLFWIRHAITRSMTLSSFTRVSFGLESVRAEIQKAKLELLFDLYRQPTEEEIIERVGISPERYQEVMRASKPVLSLHSRHAITQEEFINGITDVDGGDNRRQPALLRLALDDVLDSLKPKESLVIRQRYGLDGKGDRTLGEIAGNLNISREMVRKHEVKALMKLKHPARVDYLRRYVV